MLKVLKVLYKPLRTIKEWFIPFYIRYKNYYIPNIVNIATGKIILHDKPLFNQKTFFQGLGVVEIGKNCSFGYRIGGFHRGGSIELQARYKDARIKIGNKVATNNNIMICAANNIEIGDNSLIGQYVIMMDHEAHGINPDERRNIGEIGTIKIGNNVWIGSNVTILKNSEIGENSIVATGAVVNGKFPDNVIIGGIPAKIIKPIGESE